MHPTKNRIKYAALPLGAFLIAGASAQTAAPAPETKNAAEASDEVVVLSPFEVTAANDKGYTATNTLGGTRINTELRDLGSAISVVTSQFLQDTGATDSKTLLQYTANTEVGGMAGNFGGTGNTSQINESGALLRPNSNTRVRGLDSADNTRNYFLTNIPWDAYNVDRVDISRGANAMLFGVGSPAGIINSSLVPAKFENAFKVENKVGSFGSIRNSLDFNFKLIENELGLRIAALDDQAKFQQKPAFDRQQRLYLALRYDPSFLNTANMRSSLKVNYEYGDVKANRPRMLPPIDAMTPWWLTGTNVRSDGATYANMNQQLFDPAVAWSNNGGVAKTGQPHYSPWFNDAHFGQAYGASLGLLYDADGTLLGAGAAFPTRYHGIYSKTGPNGSDGTPSFNATYGTFTNQIGGLPYAQTVGIATFSAFAQDANRADYPGAQYGQWKDKMITDPSIYDFYNNLIDGKNKREWQHWGSFDADWNQSFFGNRIGYDIAYAHEAYRDGQESFLSGQQYQISIDINEKLPDDSINRNAGRPYVSGKGYWGNGENFITRDAYHITATGDLRASDFFEKNSLLTRILGHHQFTGLYSSDKKTEDVRQYARWAMDTTWATTLGDNDVTLQNRVRQVDYAIYIGPSLVGKPLSEAKGFSPITFDATPKQFYTDARYYNSNWNRPTDPTAAGYVDPNAPYTYYDVLTGSANTTNSSQASNPANYVGWTTTGAKVLDADKGDKNQLYYSASKDEVVVRSLAANWQGTMFDNVLVATFGVRRDRLVHYSEGAPLVDTLTGVVSMDYSAKDGARKDIAATTKLTSVVLHTPKQFKKNLPWGLDFSLFYNKSDNWNAQSTRLDIEGNDIPNSTGNTKEYGILIAALDDRISFKVNFYKSEMANATLQGSGAGLGSLGAMAMTEAVSAGNAAILARGLSTGRGQPWGWDYSWNQAGTDYGVFPRTAETKAVDDAEWASINAVIAGLPSQQFFDNYGIPINVAALKAGDWDHACTTWTPAYLDGQGNAGDSVNISNGTIHGISPVATVDTMSKGVEFELTAQPIKNLNLSINASKQTASRSNLNGTLKNFIEREKALMDGPAGDIRQWWAGDQPLRKVWTSGVYGPYLNLLAQDGSTAAEVRKWRFNGVANYSFDSGVLKGFNIGGGIRWQEGAILGYHLQSEADPTKDDIIDVSRPFVGPSETDCDLWVGYERQLTSKLNWRIQLNLRNVGKDARLIPIAVQPDGSPAQYRIMDGQIWSLTNTFTF